MTRFYWVCVVLLLALIAGCAPIEGLDGEEDNLPEIGTEETVEEVIEPAEQEVPEVTEDEVIPEEEPTPPKFVRIKADALNVREAPGIENEKLTKIYDGQIYEVLGIQPDSEGLPWYQLNTPDGHRGWVSSEYCVPGETYEELMPEEEE